MSTTRTRSTTSRCGSVADRSSRRPTRASPRASHPCGGPGRCRTPGGRDRPHSVRVQPGVDGALAGPHDLRLGLGATHPVSALDGLPGLEILVDLEEVLDLEPVELAHVVDVLPPARPLVAGRDTQDLVVAAGLVAHPEHAERTAADQATGERGLLQQDEGVERVAVLAQGAVDEAVVVRVAGRGEQHPVEPDPAGDVVDLVLVPLPLRDLDRDVELHGAPSVSYTHLTLPTNR